MQHTRRSVFLVFALAFTFAASPATFDFRGNGSTWHARVDKRVVGTGNGMTFYQWSIALYDGEKIAYESPRDGGPLGTVTKAHGAQMWFPAQSASIVGAAALMGGAAQQLVMQSHETGVDCGAATVTVFRYDDAAKRVVPAVTVRNPCDLTATLAGSSIVLKGPYYARNAALCCPTKTNASATLVYRNGAWKETPQYYALHPNAFPQY